MRIRLILLSLSIFLTPSLLLAAKKTVAFAITPFAGYRQDNVKLKTNTVSSLHWKNLRAIEYGLRSVTTLKDRYKINLDMGLANFIKGTMTDSNYLAAPGSGNPLRNTINGSGFAFRPNVAFGFNMKPLKSLDLIPQIGYEYDHLKLNSKKTTGNPLTSLSNTLQFHGPYIGIDSTTTLSKRLSLSASAAYQLSFYHGSGNWRFQGDSSSNTMNQSSSDISSGLKGQIGLEYLVVPSVSLGGQADIHWNRITSGNDTRHFANGVTLKSKLNSASWTSYAGRFTVTKSF